MFRRTCIVVFAVIFALFPDGESAEAALFASVDDLRNGEEYAKESRFQSSGLVKGVNDSGSFAAGGGTVVGDGTWVLTAAHVTRWDDDSPYSEIFFTTSPRVLDEPPNFVRVDRWYEFPGYNPTPGRGHDLALLHLEEPLGIEPAVLYRGNEEVGMEFGTAGYGVPGVWPSEGAFDGVIRGYNNKVDPPDDGLPVDPHYLLADYGHGSSTPAVPLEGAGSSLNSGDGWSFVNGDGRTEVFAVTGFSLGNHTVTGASPVSHYLPWLDQTMGEVVPEPNSFVVFAGLCLSSLLLRRRLA